MVIDKYRAARVLREYTRKVNVDSPSAIESQLFWQKKQVLILKLPGRASRIAG